MAVEEPGYQRAVETFRQAGVRVVPAPVDHAGLVVEAVPRGVRAVYCSPAHQYPLGGRLPAGRRSALVDRAREENWLIIEDDYDGELRYDVAPLPVLAALAPDVVVHLGTTSKILSPTLGAGWMLAPGHVVDAVLRHRERTGSAVFAYRSARTLTATERSSAVSVARYTSPIPPRATRSGEAYLLGSTSRAM